jgi:DNA modification methylase
MALGKSAETTTVLQSPMGMIESEHTSAQSSHGDSVSDRLTPDFSAKPFVIYQGDALDIVRRLSSNVDCVITSPPYFKQRTYGDSDKEVGNEPTVDEFLVSLVNIFVSIPIQPWGSIWVNLGDKRGKHGELLAVPERFIMAMKTSGFLLIDKVIWAKEVIHVDGTNTGGHCMIEPAPGRLNGNAWEPFYRFVPNTGSHWTDMCAVNIPREHVVGNRYKDKSLMKCETAIEGRRLPNLWSIATSSRGKGHFAPFPEALVERPIAMSCPEYVTAAGPRVRDIKHVEYDEKKSPNAKRVFGQYSLSSEHSETGPMSPDELSKKAGRADTGRGYVAKHAKHVGWTHDDIPSTPGIVLDPFCGSGTTGAVAIKLGRRFIGIDLYQEYADQSSSRLTEVFEALPPPTTPL